MDQKMIRNTEEKIQKRNASQKMINAKENRFIRKTSEKDKNTTEENGKYPRKCMGKRLGYLGNLRNTSEKI